MTNTVQTISETAKAIHDEIGYTYDSEDFQIGRTPAANIERIGMWLVARGIGDADTIETLATEYTTAHLTLTHYS